MRSGSAFEAARDLRTKSRVAFAQNLSVRMISFVPFADDGILNPVPNVGCHEREIRQLKPSTEFVNCGILISVPDVGCAGQIPVLG